MAKLVHQTKIPNNLSWSSIALLSIKAVQHLSIYTGPTVALDTSLIYCIQFKIITIVCNAVHSMALKYICDLIELKQSKYPLRSVNDTDLQEQRSHLKTCTDKAFSVNAPKLRDSLPLEVGSSWTIQLSKSALKYSTLNVHLILLDYFEF